MFSKLLPFILLEFPSTFIPIILLCLAYYFKLFSEDTLALEIQASK